MANILRAELSLESLLLRPLWGVVSDYFEPGERWYYAGVPAFGIKAGTPAPALPAALIECGHLPALAAWVESVPRPRRKKTLCRNDFSHMIQLDRVEMLEYMHRRYPKCLKRYYELIYGQGLRYAATFASIETLKWEQRHGYAPWDKMTAATLAVRGHLATLQQLRRASPPCPWDHHTMASAIAFDQVEVVKWLKTTDLYVSEINVGSHIHSPDMFKLFVNEVDHRRVLLGALTDGSTELVRYLVEQTDVEKHLDAVDRHLAVQCAAASQRFGISNLEYLLKRGYPRPERFYAYAILPDIRNWIEANGGFE